MRKKRIAQGGNTLALVVVCIAAIALLVAFFAINYGGLFGTKKQAQTAIDAAALEAAKQLASITVDTAIGPVGLTDLPRDPSKGLIVPRQGINTALATARLDYLIANDPQINNNDMKTLVNRDLEEAGRAARLLKDEMTKPGTMQAITNAARNAYLSNSRRNAVDLVNFQVELGRLNSQTATNIPIPEPEDTETSGSNGNIGKFYKSYHAYTAGAKKIVFSAVADDFTLVDAKNFLPGNFTVEGVDVAPSVVRVRAREKVRAQLDTAAGGAERQTAEMDSVACAQVGGKRSTNVSGIYCLSFRGGFPDNNLNSMIGVMNTGYPAAQNRTWFRGAEPTGSPPAAPVQSFFPTGRDGSGGQTGTTQSRPGQALAYGVYDWLRQMGLRPNRAAIVAAMSKSLNDLAAPTNGGTNWPAASAPDALFVQPAYAQGSSNAGPIEQTTCWLSLPDKNQDPRNMERILGAGRSVDATTQMQNVFGYALSSVTCPSSSAALFIPETGTTPKTADGHDITHITALQNAIVHTNKASEIAMRAGDQVGQKMQAEIDRLGKKIKDEYDPKLKSEHDNWTDADYDNAISYCESSDPPDTAKAQELKGEKEARSGKKQAEQELARKTEIKARADKVKANGAKGMDVTEAMLEHFKDLSSVGVDASGGVLKLANVVMTPHITYYSGVGATKTVNDSTNAGSEISGMARAIEETPKDQKLDCKSGNGDAWDGDSIHIYTRAATTNPNVPQIGKRGPFPRDWFAQPAHARNVLGLAANQIPGFSPPNLNMMFLYRVEGDVSKDRTNGGKVRITALPTSPFIQQNTEANQMFYQNTQGYQTSVSGPGGTVTLTWAFWARDMVANPHTNQAFLQGLEDVTRPTDTDRNNLDWCVRGARDFRGRPYNVDLEDQGSSVITCPLLDGEFVVGCPMVSGCVKVDRINNSTGTREVQPCDPPPPPMG